MVLFDPVTDARLSFIFGLTNLIGLALVFLSCRCIVKLPGRLLEHGWYRKFYGPHCYYWWFFFVSVAMHAIFALTVYGVPR